MAVDVFVFVFVFVLVVVFVVGREEKVVAQNEHY